MGRNSETKYGYYIPFSSIMVSPSFISCALPRTSTLRRVRPFAKKSRQITSNQKLGEIIPFGVYLFHSFLDRLLVVTNQ